MVYLYYGFFLFLLYMVTPWWVFLPVAVGFWWAMRSSFALQKIMRSPLSNLGLRRENAVQLEKKLKTAAPKFGKERRRFKRFASSLSVSYQVLGEEWKKEIIDHSFDGSIVYPEPIQPSNVHHALTWDVSEGGLAILADHPLKTGQPLKLSLQLPQHNAPTMLLAEVRRSKASRKWGKTMYDTGLKILALDHQDLVQLTDYLFDQGPYPDGKKLRATA